MQYPQEIHMITVVWGDEYIDFFLKFCLESLFKPLNLPVFSKAFQIIYRVQTNVKGEEWIKKTEQYNKLLSFCKVEFDLIDDILEKSKSVCEDVMRYYVMSKSHQRAISFANAANAGIIISYPDVYYANDFFKQLIEPIKNKKRLIFASTVRTIKERVTKNLGEKEGAQKDGLNSSDLKKIALSNLFPDDRKALDENLMNYGWPSVLFFKLSEKNFFYRSFNPNVLYLWPRIKKEVKAANTIDNCNYIFEVDIQEKERHFCDTNEMFFCECSKYEENKIPLKSTLHKKSIWVTMYWALNFLEPSFFSLFMQHKDNFYLGKKTKEEKRKEKKHDNFCRLIYFLNKYLGFIVNIFLFKAHLLYTKSNTSLSFIRKIKLFFSYIYQKKRERLLLSQVQHLANSKYDSETLENHLEYLLEKNGKRLKKVMRKVRFGKMDSFLIVDVFLTFLLNGANFEKIDFSRNKEQVFLNKISKYMEVASIVDSLDIIYRLLQTEFALPLVKKFFEIFVFSKANKKYYGRLFRAVSRCGKNDIVNLFYQNNLVGRLDVKYMQTHK